MLALTKAEAISLGMPHFGSDKQCKHGHAPIRFVSCNACVECARLKSKRWYSDRPRAAAKTRAWRGMNRERDAANRRAWRANNLERAKERERRYHERNPEARKEINRRQYEKNQKRNRERSLAYRNAHLEERREYQRQYNKNNRPKVAALARKRRARQYLGGSHTERDVVEIMKAQRGKCGYCRIKLGNTYHVDHIVALANGGRNDRTNLQILCAPCNQSKSAKDPVDFARSKGLLI